MREQWIIGVCNTNGDGVDLYGFLGTEEEAKEELVSMVLADKLENEDEYDYGVESVDKVKDYGKELYAYAVYYDFHIDYTAKRFMNIIRNESI